MPKTRIAVHGAAGRMGRRVIALSAENKRLQVVAAIESDKSPRLGEDAGEVAGVGALGIAIASRLPDEPKPDVVLDFSIPASAAVIVSECAALKMPIVVATTGLNETEARAIHEAAEDIPIVWSPNTSLAVNLTMKLCAVAAAALADHPEGVDVEIIDWHHRFKEDAPSGTALRFGELIAEEMGQTHLTNGRQGRPGARPRNEIGYHAVRAGDHPGEHRILFGMPGESVEIRVSATSRDAYAQGALVAARWISDKPPGLYGMQQVLGI